MAVAGCIQLPDDLNKLTVDIRYFAERREKRSTVFTPEGMKGAGEVKMTNVKLNTSNIPLNHYSLSVSHSCESRVKIK